MRCSFIPSLVFLMVLAVMLTAGRPDTALANPDTTAPGPPTGLFVAQGSAWQSTNGFNVSWQNPSDQGTPIAAVHYELCPATPPGPCTGMRVAGIDISQALIDVPNAGLFWLRLWLEDSAGNVNSSAKSPQVMLRFDDQLPPEAFMDVGSDWLNASAPISLTFDIGIDPGGWWPLSGVGGYSIAVGGGEPDGLVDIYAEQDYERFAGQYVTTDLPEGATVIRYRSISGSGAVSQDVGIATVRVDRSVPVVVADGMGSADAWHKEAVHVRVKGADQEHLSGMAPALEHQPITQGAYIETELDGQTARFAGGEAELKVAEDGQHHLKYKAYDVAGNGSVEKEVSFKIDKTAPVGAFEPRDGMDPRLVVVEASDQTSGIAGGWIEHRKVGERTFRRLATAREGGRFSARIDDEALPAGRYEVRALVADVAGNEAVISTTADGKDLQLGLPLRAQTKVTIAQSTTVKRCPKSKRRSKRKSRKTAKAKAKCNAKRKAAASAPRRFGRRIATVGSLTSSDGTSLADTTVIVEGQPRSGGAFARLGTARTDRHGKFAFAVPRGPSRTVRYSYAGNATRLPAAATLSTKVQAAAQLKVDRRRLRNGQTVRFSGSLLGKPIPKAGKLVALQAKVGKGWRTFATPRANAKGSFRHRYRFTSTTGLKRYAFRAVVTREGAYPYEKGTSRTVKVTVRGR